jgi:diguanylate cyclase (GGDEF)-like protein
MKVLVVLIAVANEDSSTIARLRALLEVTRTIRADEELPVLLDGIGRTIGDALGFRTVAISVYRHAWDDYCVASVRGSERAREALLGVSRSEAQLSPLLQEQFVRRGAYHVLHDGLDWAELEPRYVSELTPIDVEDAWHPRDALVVPMRHTNGHMLGLVSVDEPKSGLRPTDEDLDVLVAIADHAAIAVQDAQESASDNRHRLALAQLLSVSSWLSSASSIEMILPAVCHAIRDALGFMRVSIHLADALTGRLEARATVGSRSGLTSLTVKTLKPLLDPKYEIEGCYLVPPEEAPVKAVRASSRNGRGPWAWRDHWLVVPLYDRASRLVGVVQADDPGDRLLPDQERLQALRVFANQTTAAILGASQLQELRFLADHDPLTRLLNRRAFMSRLDAEVAAAVRHNRSFSLVLCDLDGFKALNDRYGHSAGDDALRALGQVLVDALRREDGAFRVGGDEFALLLVEAADDDARAVVTRVTSMLAELEDERLQGLRASFGVAACPTHAADAQALYRLADEALYAAKRGGSDLVFA